MKALLTKLSNGQTLSVDETTEAFEMIMTGAAEPAQVGALLGMIQVRGATVDEITGAATVMRAKVSGVTVPDGLTVIDTCGTGGDGAETFNISTAAALVAAAVCRPQNIAVAKHGNRAVTSKSGSSQVLETLGVKLMVSPDTLTRCLDEAGICFCFAPAHHPAMKHAGPIRASLGIRTIFNVLGPLTNPAGAKRQVMGVFSESLTEPIANVLKNLGSENAMIVHGQLNGAGLDEISTGGPTRISHLHNGTVETTELDPSSLGITPAAADELRVDGSEASAALINRIFAGEKGAPRDIVCVNAAAALVVAGIANDLADGVKQSATAIDNNDVAQTLEKLIAITQADPT